MTTIYLIRHGQAEGNLYRRCHSWHNGLLTRKGREQAKTLEQRFQGVHFDAVYSSDLYRAMSTAGAIYRSRGLPLRVDPNLREIARASGRTCPGVSCSTISGSAYRRFWPVTPAGRWRAARPFPRCASAWPPP